jgi:4-amino-4-deoxy-L-arabinose transferase-like glycosyltransferase
VSPLDAGEADEPWLRSSTLPWVLAAVALIALVIRVVWIWLYGHVIENEGTVYARLAENLRDGEGYVSMLGDRHTLMPPLFPLLTLLVAPLVGSIELAARVISCATGVASVWPVYAIGKTIAGRRAGLIAGALVAMHGVAVGFSSATYGEGTFFFLLFSATALLLRAVERPSVRAIAAAGALYGCAYLVRPETIAYLGLAAVFAVCYDLAERRPWRGTAVRAGLLVAVFALVAASRASRSTTRS